MEETEQKWYNSGFFSLVGGGLGVAAVIVAMGISIPKCQRVDNNDIELERAKAGYALQESDLNNNGKPEEFYEIGGQKYFSKIDGKSIEKSLK